VPGQTNHRGYFACSREVKRSFVHILGSMRTSYPA
jgi:hypothetical protein